MSWRSQLSLTKTDREIVTLTEAFIADRLEEPNTVQWAIELTRDRQTERAAVLWLLERKSESLSPAWRDTWRFIQMSWQAPTPDNAHSQAYRFRSALLNGDRSSVLLDEIAIYLAPWVKVDFKSGPRSVRKINKATDLLSLQMTSHELALPDAWGVDQLEDSNFLFMLTLRLTHELESAISLGVNIGWQTDRLLWRYGSPDRVGYVNNDPDKFTRGITPLVKMLHFVSAKLSELSPERAKSSIADWNSAESLIFKRLWAALALNKEVASSEAVADFLSSLSPDEFWDIHGAPEYFELRARRFGDLDKNAQKEILKRIRRLPPRRTWKRVDDRSQIPHYQRFWAAREFRRIEAAGWELPDSSVNWLQQALISHPELSQELPVDHDFLSYSGVREVHIEPEERYDQLSGEHRLEALQAALSSPRASWSDDQASRARAWIGLEGNPQRLIADFEEANDFGAACPAVWDAFGWAHKRFNSENDSPDTGTETLEFQKEVERVLALLSSLPDTTIYKAISGITWWLATWGKQLLSQRPRLRFGPRFGPWLYKPRIRFKIQSKIRNISLMPL